MNQQLTHHVTPRLEVFVADGPQVKIPSQAAGLLLPADAHHLPDASLLNLNFRCRLEHVLFE